MCSCIDLAFPLILIKGILQSAKVNQGKTSRSSQFVQQWGVCKPMRWGGPAPERQERTLPALPRWEGIWAGDTGSVAARPPRQQLRFNCAMGTKAQWGSLSYTRTEKQNNYCPMPHPPSPTRSFAGAASSADTSKRMELKDVSKRDHQLVAG